MNLDVINEMTKYPSSVKDKQALLKAFFPSSTNAVETMSDLGYAGDMNNLKNEAAAKIQKTYKKTKQFVYHFLFKMDQDRNDGRRTKPSKIVKAYKQLLSQHVWFLQEDITFDMKHVKGDVYEMTLILPNKMEDRDDESLEGWVNLEGTRNRDPFLAGGYMDGKIIWSSLYLNGKKLKYRDRYIINIRTRGQTPQEIETSIKEYWISMKEQGFSFFDELIEMPKIKHVGTQNRGNDFEITLLSHHPWNKEDSFCINYPYTTTSWIEHTRV